MILRKEEMPMFQIEPWLKQLASQLQSAFSDRLLFLGLQGSYQRGEATEHSDIDVVVILDELSPADLEQYRRILDAMPYREKACGFVSGLRELQSWPRYDVFQLYFDTRPLFGELSDWLPPFQREEAAEAVNVGCANLYHELCHRCLHEPKQDADSLKACYKAAFYILQALFYWETGRYIATKQLLLALLTGENREILQISLAWEQLEQDRREHSERYYQRLLHWCAQQLTRTGTEHVNSSFKSASVKKEKFRNPQLT